MEEEGSNEQACLVLETPQERSCRSEACCLAKRFECTWWFRRSLPVVAVTLAVLGVAFFTSRKSAPDEWWNQVPAEVEDDVENLLELGKAKKVLKILHISDTHAMHYRVQKQFGVMPPADILIASGDITNHGWISEFESFNHWLGTIKHKYKHIFVVLGNHDWWHARAMVGAGKLSPEEVLNPHFMQRHFTNAKLLHYEMAEVEGLRIFGVDYSPWFQGVAPGDFAAHDWARRRIYYAWLEKVDPTFVMPNFTALFHEPKDSNESKLAREALHEAEKTWQKNRFAEIPNGLDVLVSHFPSWHVLDHTLGRWKHVAHWGSSSALAHEIQRSKPKLHCFGHVHEARGEWHRNLHHENESDDLLYHGGVEYRAAPGKPPLWSKGSEPASSSPLMFVSNNAMANNPRIDKIMGLGYWERFGLKGRPRLIYAVQDQSDSWEFVTSWDFYKQQKKSDVMFK